MKPNFTFLDGDRVLALNRNDIEVEGVGSVIELGDGRKWTVTGLKEATYTVELVLEPAAEAPRTFPKDQPSLNTLEPVIVAPRATQTVKTPVPASPAPKPVAKTVIPAHRATAISHARFTPAKSAASKRR